MRAIIYPGSFDPITRGHLDIIVRAAKLFPKVIVGVYDTPAKNILFTTEERLDLIKRSTDDLPNVDIEPFSGLVVDFVKKVGAMAIVRGLRMGADFEREFAMSLMNKSLSPDCELVCLMADLKYQFLSSSLLKEAASLGGYIDNLVPKPVVAALREKFPSKM